MTKLPLHTANKADDNFKKLAELFPNAVTETLVDGEVVRAIDKDILAQEISANVVEGNEERYQFTWPDKKKSVLLAHAPNYKTLRPCREESVNFDNTENLYIEGDNLDVLKLLQETYLGKVKMIYIDPPYNTGKDFVYADDFKQSVDEYSEISKQLDEDGNRLFQNSETNGRYHTDWLNMIYPRLKLAKDLLKDDGVIFISIDDNEVANLKKICNEIFGAWNFVAQLVWQNKKGGGNDSLYIATEHEFILVYAKSKSGLNNFYEMYSEKYIKRYKDEDETGKFFWDTFKRKSGKQYYPIECPDGTILEFDEDGNPISWLRSQARFHQDICNGEVRIVKMKNSWSVQFKQRMPEGKKPRSIYTTEEVVTNKGTTSSGASDVYEYFKKDVFSNPKPVELIKFILGFGLVAGEIVVDFFSGSGTIAEAVMYLNASDNGERKYIAVQLQEDIDKMLLSSSANAKRVAENAVEILNEIGKPHFITELSKERIRRAGAKLKDEKGLDAQNLDIGFRVLKVDSTNMKDVYYSPNDVEQQQLNMFIDNIKDDRTPEDLLFQVMLDLGVFLSCKIETEVIDSKKLFVVYQGTETYLIACFDSKVSMDVVTAIAKRKPYYAVFRDSSMASDSLMTSFEQIFETYSKDTVRKVL